MIPEDPAKLKSEFCFHYIEDDNGHIPKCYEGVITYIPLECIVEDGIIKLFGKHSIYKTKCFDLKLNNHNYGIAFSVNCLNKHEDFKNKKLWRRTVDKEFLHKFFQNTDSNLAYLELEGDTPDVPNCPVFNVKLDILKNRRDYHVVNISTEIPLDIYALFISRLSDM